MTPAKKQMLAYLSTLVALAISQRDWIWDIIKPWPRLWKIVAAVSAGVFITLVLLHSLDLLHEFLSIFNININILSWTS